MCHRQRLATTVWLNWVMFVIVLGLTLVLAVLWSWPKPYAGESKLGRARILWEQW